MKFNKATKKELKGIIVCRQEFWRGVVDQFWPRWRWKIPVVEIVEKAWRLGINVKELCWIIRVLDWERMERYNWGSESWGLCSSTPKKELWEMVHRYRRGGNDD